MTGEQLFQCPCCDYFTLAERGGWEICRVCFWEDGDTDLHRPDERSGCNNGLTLRTARENFQRIGACDAKMLAHVCSRAERAGYHHEQRSV
ncbi:MAG TPA: CPCC family cysteine-rich protein [Gemmata sp.]